MIAIPWRIFTCTAIAMALLTGCGTSSQKLTPSQPLSSSQATVDARTGSWMLPEASSENLLYVTNYSYVSVYTYPEGKLVGTLKKFVSAVGECVDAKGDVFVTNFHPHGVYEYAHGGTKRVAFFKVTTIGPVGCAINPKNGDLAISGFSSYVEIYKGAQGKPGTVNDPNMVSNQFDTYDSNGDLFVLGLRTFSGTQQLSELPSGSVHFKTINPDAALYADGGIQWNKGYLAAISDSRHPSIYQLEVNGSTARKVGATPLDKPAYIVLQYFIDGSTVVVPNLERSHASNVLYYNYPVGGQPIFALTEGAARGVVISHASF